MEAYAPCFPRLQVIRDPAARTGPMNMALDEVLLGSASETATLRRYDWSEPTVSFGYFEPSASARRVAAGRPVVRRWTGGGIVEHGEDLTYSLCVPRSCPFTVLRSAESYRRVHAAVARALFRGGVPAELYGIPVPAPPSVGVANACFERPVLHDLVAGGRKVAGGAQRRNRAGLLHQGSANFLSHSANAARRESLRRRTSRRRTPWWNPSTPPPTGPTGSDGVLQRCRGRTRRTLVRGVTTKAEAVGR